MKSLVVTGLTAVTCLFLGAADVFAQYYDEAPGATAKAPGASADATPAPGGKSKSRRSRPRRARRASADEFEESGRRVWSETGVARIKTVYDDQGNVVYQKAWDKRTGKEIPVPEAGRDAAEEDTSRAQRVHEPSDRRPYGRLRRDEDGEFEERRADPRPKHRNHHMHTFPPVPRKHPYEFSLSVGAWFAVLDGNISGATGEGDLRSNDNTAFTVDFHNPRVGYSYTRLSNSTRVDGTFTFSGVTFTGDTTPTFYDEEFGVLDGFYRFNCYDSRDHWLDFLLGAKVVFVEATVRNALATEEVDTIVPLPQLGLIGAYSLLDNIKIRGFVKGAFGALEDSSATVVDTEIEAVYTFPGDNEYSFLNQFSVGYKYLLIDFTTNQDTADETSGSISHDGPVVKFQALF